MNALNLGTILLQRQEDGAREIIPFCAPVGSAGATEPTRSRHPLSTRFPSSLVCPVVCNIIQDSVEKVLKWSRGVWKHGVYRGQLFLVGLDMFTPAGFGGGTDLKPKRTRGRWRNQSEPAWQEFRGNCGNAQQSHYSEDESCWS